MQWTKKFKRALARLKSGLSLSFGGRAGGNLKAASCAGSDGAGASASASSSRSPSKPPEMIAKKEKIWYQLRTEGLEEVECGCFLHFETSEDGKKWEILKKWFPAPAEAARWWRGHNDSEGGWL